MIVGNELEEVRLSHHYVACRSGVFQPRGLKTPMNSSNFADFGWNTKTIRVDESAWTHWALGETLWKTELMSSTGPVKSPFGQTYTRLPSNPRRRKVPLEQRKRIVRA